MYASHKFEARFFLPRGGKDGYIINSKYSLMEVLSLFQDLTQVELREMGGEGLTTEFTELHGMGMALERTGRHFAAP
jgi:hypothetical protein